LNLLGAGALLGALCLGAGSSAWAEPSIYFGTDVGPLTSVLDGSASKEARSLFEAKLASQRNEEFVTRTDNPSDLPNPLFGGDPKVTLSGEGTVTNADCGPEENDPCTGRFDTTPGGGTSWWESASIFTLEFEDPISAFGFYATDVGDFNARLLVRLFEGTASQPSGNDSEFITVIEGPTGGEEEGPEPPNGSLLFWGFTDATTQYWKIEFVVDQYDRACSESGKCDFVGFDSLVFGPLKRFVEPPPTDIPEPGTLALGALSLGLLGFARRHRRPR
jgi:hypothetical protein